MIPAPDAGSDGNKDDIFASSSDAQPLLAKHVSCAVAVDYNRKSQGTLQFRP